MTCPIVNDLSNGDLYRLSIEIYSHNDSMIYLRESVE